MKKVIILGLLLLTLTGCISVNNSSYEEIIQSIASSKREVFNTYRKVINFIFPRDYMFQILKNIMR